MGEYVPNVLFKAREILDDATGRGDELLQLLLDAGITLGEPLELFTKDETMRLEALQMAINTLPLVRTAQQGSFIDRAQFFVNYIKTGETPNAETT